MVKRKKTESLADWAVQVLKYLKLQQDEKHIRKRRDDFIYENLQIKKSSTFGGFKRRYKSKSGKY